MRIEFGSIEIKTPYEEYIKKFVSSKNPIEDKFFKSNPGLLNDIYINVTTSMFNYTKEFTKIIKYMLMMGSQTDMMVSKYNGMIKKTSCCNKASAGYGTEEKLLNRGKDELADGCE